MESSLTVNDSDGERLAGGVTETGVTDTAVTATAGALAVFCASVGAATGG